ncbi:ArsC/Spx/MgsR family protein [Loigolactobacillus coryniformis]|uniref:ArsC/Spx/MgsR family protein n=1 Tax=Loigolactobacillus coryniformis TaxID=1610 RepID=UPI003F2557D5
MINLYFHTSDPAKRKMLDWFHYQKIETQTRNIMQKRLTKLEIRHLFLLSDNGSDDLIATRSKTAREYTFDNSLTFDQLVTIVYKHPKIMKNPIAFNENNLISGFNLEDIGVFIPRIQRKRERLSLFSKLYTVEFG